MEPLEINFGFAQNILYTECALILPFAKQIIESFNQNPEKKRMNIAADTTITERDIIERQMWLLKLILSGSFAMMTSYKLTCKKGKFSVEADVSRIENRDNHQKVIDMVHERGEKALAFLGGQHGEQP